LAPTVELEAHSYGRPSRHLARIIEMARTRFPGDEPTAQAFTRDAYNAEEITAFAAAQDIEDEQQAILDTARRAAQLRSKLCAEPRGKKKKKAILLGLLMQWI
jgi:hypothetical protein